MQNLEPICSVCACTIQEARDAGRGIEIDERPGPYLTWRCKSGCVSEVVRLRAELETCKRLATNYRDALVSIEEYWNRDSNERAMHDACWHVVNTAQAALAAKGE